MTIEAELPDGRILEFPDGTDPAVIQATVKRVLASSGPAPQKSTVGSELKRGAQQLASSMRTAYGAVTGSPEEAAKAGIERGQAISREAGEGVGFDPVKKAYQESGLLSAAGEAASQVPRALAGQGANLAVMAGGARAGALAGSKFGPVGGIVGGALGAGAAMVPQFFGSNVERQAAEQMERGEPVKIDRAKAAVAATGQAALEGAGTAFTLGKGVVKGVLGITDDAVLTSARTAKQLEDTARRSLLASTGRGAVRGAAVEMPVEIAQQVVERAQAGLDLMSPEALAEYGDAAYQAGLIGGPLGGAGNIVSRGQAQQKLEEQTRAEAAARAAAQPPQEAPTAPPTPEPELAAQAAPTEPTPAAEPTPSEPAAAEPEATAEPTPTAEPAPAAEPAPGTLTMKDVEDTGIAPSTTRTWFEQNVVGKTADELQALVDKDPTLLDGKGKRAKILRELLAPRPATFKEPANVPPTPKEPTPEPRPEPRASEPSVGVPSEPAAPVVPESGAGVAGPAAEPATPDGLGLVPAGQPAVPRVEAQGSEPLTVTPQGSVQERLQALIDDPKAPSWAKRRAFTALDSLLDPALNQTAEERRLNTAYAEKELDAAARSAQAPKSVTGKSSQNIEPALNDAAARSDTRGVLQAITAGPDGLYNALDKAVAKRMLLTAKLPTIQIVPEGSLGKQGDKEVAGAYDPATDTVMVADGYVTGSVLLHELVHGYVHTAITMHESGARLNPGVRNLREVYDHVAKTNPALMSEYGMTNLSEFASEAMSNSDFQAKLQAIPYRRQNAFTAFAQAVLRILGLSPTAQHTALAAAVISTDSIMTAGRELQLQTTGEATPAKRAFAVAPSTEALIESMGPLDPVQSNGVFQSITGFKAGMSPAEPSYAVKFRTQVADTAATIEHRLREQFDGAVRNSLGKLNPMGLYRQAQDYTKTLLEYFQVGGLVKDPATGLWVVQSVEGVRPPAEVYKLIDAWGAKNGYSRERATQIASRVLEGVRLAEMRRSNQQDGTSFLLHLKDNEIDQLVAEYNADPDLQAMSKAMDESRIAMVDNMVAVGRLTPEQGQQWKEVSGYVPFDRMEDFASSFSKIKKVSNKGLAQIGKLPELVGSMNRPVGNVFDNYLNTLGWMVGQTMKTDATVQTLRSLEDLGYAKFLGRSTQQKENTVGMYVKGEMMYWELPSKYDVLAFKDLNPPKAGWLRNLGKFSNVLRKSVTALPPFALKQVTDDVQRAIMTSGVKNPGALLRMSLSNFGGIALAELRGIQHPAVRQFGKLGLTGEYDFESGKPAVSLLKDLGYKKRGRFETLLHRLDGITRASDLAVRKAIYDQTLKETNDQLLAQTRAREFINFRRRGASDFVGAMVTTIPFFNAYIQGMDVLYRAASGKDSSSSIGRAQARQMFWSRAATVMMLSSLYALGAGDDEDYQEMDLRTRDSNWILPGGYKLPVPSELGALFKVIPERVVEYMRRQGTPEEQTAWEATRTALAYMFEQYVGRTVPVPQAVKPLLEAWTNYSFFTGRELEGIYQKQQDPSQRRAANTSELAIAIANFARDTIGVDKVSPILVDNALNGYFGSTAGLLVAMTDSLLNPTRVDRPLHKWALVSNYMYDPVGTRRMTEFYETREKVGRANATLNELMKTDIDRAAKYAEEHAPELMLEGAINSTLEQLERTRAYRKYLNSPDAAKEMPKEMRELELQELRKMEVSLTGWLREAKLAVNY